MGKIRLTDQHHCVTLVSLSVTVSSLIKATEPDDTKVPVNGNNVVTSQTTATADPQSARLPALQYHLATRDIRVNRSNVQIAEGCTWAESAKDSTDNVIFNGSDLRIQPAAHVP